MIKRGGWVQGDRRRNDGEIATISEFQKVWKGLERRATSTEWKTKGVHLGLMLCNATHKNERWCKYGGFHSGSNSLWSRRWQLIRFWRVKWCMRQILSPNWSWIVSPIGSEWEIICAWDAAMCNIGSCLYSTKFRRRKRKCRSQLHLQKGHKRWVKRIYDSVSRGDHISLNDSLTIGGGKTPYKFWGSASSFPICFIFFCKVIKE